MINKKIALSLVSIAAALTVTGGAAYAAFTSEASNNGNTFGSGNMVLNLNGQPGGSSSPVFNVTNGTPGSTSTQVITLSNTGNVAASSVMLTGINVGGSTVLGDELTLNIYNDVNGDGVKDGGDTLQGSAHITDPAWTNIPLGFGLAANGGSHQIIAEIVFDADAPNSVQGLNTSFNLNFQEVQ
jgi:hypothetical protein